jgi:RNase H
MPEPTLDELNQEAIDLGLVTVEQVCTRLLTAIISNYYYVEWRARRGIVTPTDLAKRQEMAAMARAIILLRNEQRQNMGKYTHLTIYTDGASRGNPGPAASGIHIVDATTSETVADFGCALGIATNNVAEYQAVLHEVKWLLTHKELLADDIHISFRLDSSLVVSQLSGSTN